MTAQAVTPSSPSRCDATAWWVCEQKEQFSNVRHDAARVLRSGGTAAALSAVGSIEVT